MLLFVLFSLLIKLNLNFAVINNSSNINQEIIIDACHLENFGCNDFLLHSDQASSLGCPFGIRKIQCAFDNDQNVFNNQFRNLIQTLNKLDKCCWSKLSFENAYEIVNQSFLNVNFRKRSVDGLFEDVYMIFEKAYKIESISFEMDGISEEDAESLYIVFDDIANFTHQVPRSLKLQNDSFQNLNCKELKFTNMFSNKFLSLNTKMFYNSNIKQLVITQTNFTGFVIDDEINYGFDVGFLETLLFDNCLLNAKINKNLIGNFYSLSNLYVVNSGIEIIDMDVFNNYSDDNNHNKIKQFVLDNNLIKKIDLLDTHILSELEYLSINNNPLVELGKATFGVFSQTLKKLDLRSTNIANFEIFYPIMPNIEEIMLGNNHYINTSDILHLIRNSPKLNYFDLTNTNMILKSNLLNVLEQIDGLLLKTKQNLIKYLDIRSLNDEYGVIENSDFFERISKYEKDGYLNNLLTNTFIRVNANHPCNCALFYLYRNIFRYEIPNESATNYFEIIDNYLHTYSTLSANSYSYKVILNLPKCLRSLPLENIYNEFNIKCNNFITSTTTTTTSTTSIKTTTEVSTPLTIPIETTLVKTTNNIETIETTLLTTTKNNKDDWIEEKPKLIKLADALPFMIALVLLMLISLIMITFKYKIDHKRKFLKSCENTINSFEQNIGTEGSLESSLEINSNNSSDTMIMKTFWSSFKYHSKKKVKKLNLKRIF